METPSTPPKMELRSYEDLRKKNLEDNKIMLAKIMSDIKGCRPAVKPPQRAQKRKSNKIVTPEAIRRNPTRSTRFSTHRFDLPGKRPRSGSVSSGISSTSSCASTPSSTPEKLVVRFGFFRKPECLASLSSEQTDDRSDEEWDADDDCPLPNVKRKPRSERVVRSPDDITQMDLDMVATFVSDKKYDSIYGTTCHQCRQKTNDMKTVCRSDSCFGVRGQFCGPCLRNRYGEDAKEALKDPDWICPPCRNICNCSFCRKKKGKSSTGILIHMAREQGYHDVCSYLKGRCVPMTYDLLEEWGEGDLPFTCRMCAFDNGAYSATKAHERKEK